MAFAPLIIGIVGMAMSAIGQIQQGKAANAVAQRQAQQDQEAANYARQAAAAKANREREAASFRMGTQEAEYSSSGVTLGGSPFQVIRASLRAGEMDALTTQYSGMMTARAKEEDATLTRFKGKSAQQAGYWGAGTTILTGAARMGAGSGLFGSSPSVPAYRGGYD